VAVEVAHDFAFHGSSDTALAALKHDFKEHFPRKLGQRWHKAVRDDARKQGDSMDGDGYSLESLFPRYGTTLLVTLVVPGALLVGQIGDGDIRSMVPGQWRLPFPPGSIITRRMVVAMI
jgi:hypothetical protein